MGLLGAISFSIALVSLTQIPFIRAACHVSSAESSGPGSILVKWEHNSNATQYILDLRVKDNNSFAPVVVLARKHLTEKKVQGLRPGTNYTVTLKVLRLLTIQCTSKLSSCTVPDTSQITSGIGLSSTSVSLEWTEVPSAEYYILVIESQHNGDTQNLTYTTESATVVNLRPSTNYDCYVYSANWCGVGSSSKVRTITTLVQPPIGIKAEQTGRNEADVTWEPVEDVLMYRVMVENADEPNAEPAVFNVTDTKIHLTDIQPCSEYLISISSYNMFLVPSEPNVYTYITNSLNPVSAVEVEYSCETNSATVMWVPVLGADSYKATAMTEGGTPLVCTGTLTSCTISGVSCGTAYDVHVTPISENCENQVNSTSASFHSVPCPPQNLSLLRTCESEVIVFSWERTSNTQHYKAKSVDAQGVVMECLTEDNSCYFTHTQCGRHYTFSVYSISDDCNSQISETVDISTAPCIPQNVQISADCNTNALVSKWDLADGATTYTVEAYGNMGNNSYYNCTSHSNSCSIEGLSCGEALTVYITSHDAHCSSPRTLVPEAQTGPCVPQNVTATTDCEANAIVLSWNMAGNAIFYMATAVDSAGNLYYCNTMELTCTFKNLVCSTGYSLSVISSNMLCNSSTSEVATIETVACPPSNIISTLDCARNEALISWTAEPRINSFTVAASDEDSGILGCSSTTSSCVITNLKCDQSYSITVSYHDAMCPLLSSDPITMDSVHCGPNVTADVDCATQVMSASWDAVSNADSYEIRLSDGTTERNVSTVDTSFNSNDLECGTTYTLEVRSMIDGCVSRPTTKTVTQAPCAPTNVMMQTTCQQSDVDVSWQQSLGAVSYEVTAVSSGAPQQQCNSTATTCTLEDLLCGQTYAVTVSAWNEQCYSQTTGETQLVTEPCPPSGLVVTLNCADNSATLVWDSSPNAVSYSGRAVSTTGNTVTCDAGDSLGCLLEDLECGQIYDFYVTASDDECETADSDSVTYATAPCPVTSVSNEVDCATNSLTTSWTAGDGPLNYTVKAEKADGTFLVCHSDESSCVLSNLPCGERYTVTVSPVSSTCTGESSEAYVVNTAPCVPDNVKGEVECSDNTLHTSWDLAAGSASYIAHLSTSEGFSSDCYTPDGFCTFYTLQCAQTYTLTVSSSNDRCNSSSAITVQTAPCNPTDVTASVDCPSGVATVDWTASPGASYYNVLALVDDYQDNCRSEQTSCELSNLHCGLEYSVIVLAGDGICNSSILTTETITTAPCPPVMQNYTLNCGANSAVVPWVKDEDAQSVTVTGVSGQGHSVSCSSSDGTSCVLSDLQCSSTYIVTAVAQGVQCASEASTPFNLVTAPCAPANVTFTNGCNMGIAFLSWQDTPGRKSFYATATSETETKICNALNTGCPLSSMDCGQIYDVKVFAIGEQCNSSMPAVTQIQTAPCAPQDVVAALECQDNTASVSWAASTGAVSYTVSALPLTGESKECTTSGTSCDIPNMQCGEPYRIKVTPFSDDCQGYDSVDFSYLAGPCPPTEFTVVRECTGNVALVSWTGVPNAEFYEASAYEALTDHTHNCSSESTTCSITDLHCGETVSVTVLTKERGCWSQPSTPFVFEAVICPPSGLSGETTCSNNDITVSWNPSPKPSVTYILNSEKSGGSSEQHTTVSTSHMITGLQCGELYTLQVSAQYQECTSDLSDAFEAVTAPCPPTDLKATTDCGTSSGMLTWTGSAHTSHYTATLTGDHGHVATCTTNTTNCTVKLDCGHQYTASLIASTSACDSSSAATVVFTSAPCLPGNVVATPNCVDNSFSVTWDGDSQSGPYTALAIGSDDSRLSCDTPDNQCTIENLKCGLLYSIVVTTADLDCGEITDSDYKVHSAPCKPTDVSLDLNCDTNDVVVHWEGTGPDQEQEVTAQDARGNAIHCNSSSHSCTFNDLSCGLSYDVSVVGKSGSCTSDPTSGPTLRTAPCVATNVAPLYDCLSAITLVTWNAANGATSYTVEAKGSLGHNDQCQNSVTSCDFTSLACGQDYNITVQSVNSECVSAVSETAHITTGPCPHSSVNTNLDCSANYAVVSWVPGSGILYYNATATAINIESTEECSTNGSSCNITTMQCGESYSIEVTGQGQICPSPSPGFERIDTAPCPPTLLSVDSSCNSDDIVVNWQTSKGAVSYIAMAENEAGEKWSCDSGDTQCQISDLPCGQLFNVYVLGRDGDCIGARSNVEVFETAPCVPQNIALEMDCPSSSLNVSWDILGRISLGIEFYMYYPNGEQKFCFKLGCKVSDRSCVVPIQECGESYDVKLKALGAKCNSSRSDALPLTTAPCQLPSFDTSVDCGTGLVSVTWSSGVADVLYSVLAVGPDGVEHSCSSSDGGCDLNTLGCGTKYNVTITPSQDGCVGSRSAPQMIQTVPCVPELQKVEVDCLTNSIWVMGTESAGAEDYVITAADSAGGVQTFQCNSTLEDMCFLPPLACSNNFTFTIQARDQQCSSDPSNSLTAETGPCSPQGIVSKADCDSNDISISWTAVPGAVSYTATLEDFDGKTSCCTSSDNSCDISDLPCGQMYVLLVTAEGRTCNSSESREMARTVPCVPQNLDYNLRCSDNLVSMSWNHSQGGQLYQVTAVNEDGDTEKCSGHKNKCDLTNLQCGQTYTVTVTAEDMDCSSKPSDSVSIKTVPCTPQDLSSSMDCGSSSLSITWTDSDGADSYLATVVNSYGELTTCQATTEGQCSVLGLGCGGIYHVSLVASDGKCDSPSTNAVGTPSVPCEPNNVRAEFDCEAGSALVSWYPSDGAVLYIVTGTSDSGDSATCQTSTTTHCVLEELVCGQSYSIEVLAVGETCNSTSIMSGQMHTGPCDPSSISMDYTSSIAQVSWVRSLGAERYTAEIVTEQGSSSQCDTTDEYCAFYDVECSQTYSATITAYNDACPYGVSSNETAQFTTEPCPPKNLQATVQAQTNTASVTWEPSFGAVSYTVSVSGQNSQTLHCATEETFCQIEGLECGVFYNLNAVAVGDTMNSSESDSAYFQAGPCPVEDVIVDVDGYNSSAVLMWSPALGATSYEIIATATEGHRVSCMTNETECELEDLECGQIYSITSVSVSDEGSVWTDTGDTFGTRPCKPYNVDVNFDCGTATATMFWEEMEGLMYNATAVSSSGVTSFCSTDSPPCVFSNLDCGETYEFYVVAVNDICPSEPSETVSVHTEPCQPSGLDVQGSCYNDTVELSWADATGAQEYTVKISGNLGYVTTFQTTETSFETALPCGQLYTFTVVALDDRCSSAFSESVQHQKGPCVPRDVQSYTSCEDSIGAVSWAPTDGADYYLAVAIDQEGSSTLCTTENTTCVWDDLRCGEFYTVYVTAVNDECESGESNSTTIRMASCKPQNLVSSFNCSMKVGYLSWDAVDTADSYIATAESNSGHRIQLSTNETSAYISEFSCGEDYFLSVQSVDEHCTSIPSLTSKLQSEPCPPLVLSSFMNCVANIAVVSWNSSAGGDYYTATFTSEDGTSRTCWSDNDQCGIPNLPCGQQYTVSVQASNKACNSDISAESQLMSVPCVPSQVKVTMDCANNEASVSWDASQGALMYSVLAQTDGGSPVSCETSELSCVLKGLECGQYYSVKVTAKDDICSSWASPVTYFNSVPCVPASGSVVVDCVTKSAIVDWMFSEGARDYVTTAESEDGDVVTCSSNYTHCELMDLQCGQSYQVSVQAANDACRSPPSTAQQFESVPCPPQGVTSSLDCHSNSITVEWEHSDGSTAYFVEALGIQEDIASCTSQTDSCVLEGLMCGFTYNISVSAQSDLCNTSSSVIQQHSVPCVPQNLRADFDCENRDVKVTWEQTSGALRYSGVAQGLGGFTADCNTTDTWCTFSNLACDMNYTVTVMASDDECSSHASAPEEVYTGPCEPQNVVAEMLCDSDTGVVSWEEGDSVTSYSVHGYGPDGHSVSCDTKETTCQLQNMHCGQTYALTITANDGRCDNSQTAANLTSVPCTPTNVGASLVCHSNMVAVTWERASGARSYSAVAVSADGSHTSECSNNETHCDLTELKCGTEYAVTVFGKDDSCSSAGSPPVAVHTAPCTPQDVVVNEQCAEGSMTISWSSDTDAQYFIMNAYSASGDALSCNTTEQSCSFSSLPCGQHYSVIVVAFHHDCPSTPAGPVETSSAPCVPTNIKGNLDCVTNSVWITWTEADGAKSYYVFAKTQDETHNSSCTSAESPCGVPDLKCGTHYDIQVTSQNDHCSSEPTANYELETAPCALTSINATTQCDSSVITVQWQKSDNMPMYVATAEGHDMTQIMCNSTSNSCQLNDATCGMHYTVIVATSSVRCTSLRSPPKKINTVPCAPQNVTASQSCTDDGVTVSYALSPVATSYRVDATGPNYSSTCESTQASCTLSNLPCGTDFELTVYALTENCTSPGTTISYSSGPCPPTGLVVNYDCETLSAELTWDPSTGTDEYFASAQTPDHDPIYCSSTGLSCTIDGLLCGSTYSFNVEASNNVCNSSSGSGVTVGAVPCAPTELNVRIQLMEERFFGFWAMISWDRVSCPDVEYQVTINGHINDNVQTQMDISSYWLERNYYETPLPNSSTYKMNVYARNQAGKSPPSPTKTGVTVPSPPQNVVYNEAADELRWDASVLATSYSVFEEVEGVKVGLCETPLLSCSPSVTDLSKVGVTASNSAGTSLPSVPTVATARRRRDSSAHRPLPIDENLDTPSDVTVTIDENELTVQWSPVTEAEEYIVEYTIDEDSEPTFKIVTDTYVTVTVNPGSTYSVRVAARTISHQSHYSTLLRT